MKVEISTSVKKYDPTYTMVVRAYETADVTQLATITTKESFTNWFDVDGNFLKKPFDSWLGQNIIKAETQLLSNKKKK